MLDKKNLVTTMVAQHRVLQQDLTSALQELGNENFNEEKESGHLQKFKQDLVGHLTLENNVFYVELLKNMKERGQNTAKTEMFIAEMKEIEVAVLSFLEKYADAVKIKKQAEDLKIDLPKIIETLNLRIESEEVGVYAYWGLF